VFQENGQYGVWPENHGIWAWGEGILVGFVKASFKQSEPRLHTDNPKSGENQFERSLDGGRA